ncbi:unnamed protein product [Ambrosiozyma monospora]|uniref:Unnamed protein product n=1 Tax=Ambrosiozyma monospora TaxID=43982 RepID=A0ACB5U0H6_AMBMO|nr:unnamed protein product [Ambrosiozyma monospora]
MLLLKYEDLIELFHCSIDDSVYEKQIGMLLPVSMKILSIITNEDDFFYNNEWEIANSDLISTTYLKIISGMKKLDKVVVDKFKFLINFQIATWMDFNWDEIDDTHKRMNKTNLLKALKSIERKHPTSLNLYKIYEMKLMLI